MGRGGEPGRLAQRAAAAAGAGLPLGDALRRAGFPEEDCVVFDAGAATGRIGEICNRLADHYEKLATARAAILTRSLYPVFLLHFAVILLAIPHALLAGANPLPSIAIGLGGFYAAVSVVILAASALRAAFARHCATCAILLLIPGLGFWFRTRTNARFARIFSLFVRSGGGLLRGLELAGASSGSALLRRSTQEAVSAVRSGSTLSTAIAGRAGLATEIERAIQIGDRSGRLDEETLRAAETLEARSLKLLDALAEWLPRLLYIGVVLYAGWRILGTAFQIGGAFNEVLDQ